jgi:hypothetical protein
MISLSKSDVVFSTHLNIRDCQTRLEAKGVSVWKIKTFFARKETNELGFLWYENLGPWSVLLQGPALLGAIKQEEGKCRIQASFRPWLNWKFVLVLAAVLLLLFLTYDVISTGQVQITRYNGIVVMIGIVVAVYWIGQVAMRPYWSKLAKRLEELLGAD